MNDKIIDKILDNGDRLHGRNGYPETATTKDLDKSEVLPTPTGGTSSGTTRKDTLEGTGEYFAKRFSKFSAEEAE